MVAPANHCAWPVPPAKSRDEAFSTLIRYEALFCTRSLTSRHTYLNHASPPRASLNFSASIHHATPNKPHQGHRAYTSVRSQSSVQLHLQVSIYPQTQSSCLPKQRLPRPQRRQRRPRHPADLPTRCVLATPPPFHYTTLYDNISLFIRC